MIQRMLAIWSEGFQNWDPADAASPHGDCWGAGGMQEARWTKKQDLVPESWAAYERNEFSELRSLHHPIHRMLNSLTWYPIFDVQTPCPFVANLEPSFYSLTRGPASLEQFPQSYWDAVSWAQSPKHSHQIKNSLLSGCDYIFFSWQFKASWYCLDHHTGILVWLFLLKAPSSWDASLVFLTEFWELWDPSWCWVGWHYQWPPYRTESVISKFTYQGHSSYCWYFKN